MSNELSLDDILDAAEEAVEMGLKPTPEPTDVMTDYHEQPHPAPGNETSPYAAALTDTTEFTISVKDMMAFLLQANEAVSHPALTRQLEKQFIGKLPSILVYSLERFFAIHTVGTSDLKKPKKDRESTLVYSVDWWSEKPSSVDGKPLPVPVQMIHCKTEELLGGTHWNPYQSGQKQKQFDLICKAEKGKISRAAYLESGGTEKLLKQFIRDHMCIIIVETLDVSKQD